MAILIGVPAAEAVGFAVDATAVKAITIAASGSAYFSFLRRDRFTGGSPLCGWARCLADWTSEGGGELVAGGGGSGRAALEIAEAALPDPEQAVGREQHDGEEDQPDQGVERAELDASDREVGRRQAVVDVDVGERADERALDPAQAADDGDDEDV